MIFYNFLIKKDANEESFQLRQISKLNASLRIAFFACEAAQESILTIDKLMSKEKIIVNRCYLCKKVEEACDYILLHCPIAYTSRSTAFGILGHKWVMAGIVKGEIWA